MNEFIYLNNQFLIAMPTMDDPTFHQSVIYICEHNEQGAIGIVINRPISLLLADILGQLEIVVENPDLHKQPILYGGPIHQERGFVIHRPSGTWRSSFSTEEGITVTTSRDILQAMAENKGPKEAIVSLGYSGWSAGQLELELANNLWLTSPIDPHIIFDIPYEKRWSAAASLIGVDTNKLTRFSGRA